MESHFMDSVKYPAIRSLTAIMFCRSSLTNRLSTFSRGNMLSKFRREFHLASPVRTKFSSARGTSVTLGYHDKKVQLVSQRRSVYDFPISDYLLSFLDVAPKDDRFLNYMSVEDYESSSFEDELYTKAYVSSGYYKRLVTVLPLYTDHDQKVVPIPCIIDTGAPATLVLGAGAMAALKQKNLVIGDTSIRAAGIIKKNGREIMKPWISQLPDHYESDKSITDVRFNLLGLHGLQDLEFIVEF